MIVRITKFKIYVAIFAILSVIVLPLISVLVLSMAIIGGDAHSSAALNRMKMQSYIALEPTELARKEIPADVLDVLLEMQNHYSIPWTVVAAFAKHKTNFGKNIPKNTASIYGLSAEWWSGKGSDEFGLDPSANVANGGWGKNDFDIPDNKDEIDAAIAHNASCPANNTSCPVPVPAPVYTANVHDVRDATFAVARFLEREGFQTDPRKALVKLAGRRSLVNKIISTAQKYGHIVERSTVPAYYFANNQIPRDYIPIYRRAADAFGVPWTLLAAVHRVATTFSTGPMSSSSGAEGPLQFPPCLWVGTSHPSCTQGGKGNFSNVEETDPKFISSFGGYGTDANGDGKADMWNLEDATFSLARFLATHGARNGNLRSALVAYKASDDFADEVLRYMAIYDSGYVAVSGATYIGQRNAYIRWPVDLPYTITSQFGYRTDPINGKPGAFHQGTDIVGSKEIRAIADGRVVFAGYGESGSGYGGLGNVVAIDHGNSVYSLYAHMADGSLRVRTGDVVTQGTQIGVMGSTGRSTGVHLHFEIRFFSPKRDSQTVPVNPVCVYKATSSSVGGISDWTAFLHRLGTQALRSC